MAGRYELSDTSLQLVKSIVSGNSRPCRDDRQILNEIFLILCSGAEWRDLPERCDHRRTIYDRLRQWREDGTFEAVLDHLHLKLREDGLMDLET